MASATELITSVTEDESPRLPPELERIIFEMAAYDIVSKYPAANSAINLQLIAKHVQCWCVIMHDILHMQVRIPFLI